MLKNNLNSKFEFEDEEKISYNSPVDEDLKILINNINELNNLYSGKDIDFLFQEIISQNDSLSLISSMLEDYNGLLLEINSLDK